MTLENEGAGRRAAVAHDRGVWRDDGGMTVAWWRARWAEFWRELGREMAMAARWSPRRGRDVVPVEVRS